MDRRTLLALIAAALLAGCANYRPQDLRAGMTEAEAVQTLGLRNTGRYPGPNGQTRVEFATGPFGRVTWMIDLDASGRVVEWDQVLDEHHFTWVQTNFQGRDREWLLYHMGRPGEVRGGGWQGGQVWSYRYPTNECLWYQVSILDSGLLRDGGSYGIDPRCDAPSDRPR
jgi:hypothetical protein